MAEAEAERDLGQLVDFDVEVAGNGLHALPHLVPALAGKVLVAEVVVGKHRLRSDGTGQRSLVERDSRDHADTRCLDGGEESILRTLDRFERLAHGGADQLLAVAVPVAVGGVQEVDAVLDRKP